MTKKIVINHEFGDSFTLTYQPKWALQVQDEAALDTTSGPSTEQDEIDTLLSGWLKRTRRSPAPGSEQSANQQTLDHEALAAEELIFEWCLEEARFSSAARILAAVYVAAAGGPGHICLGDLRTLKPAQRAWALILLNAYVDGRIAIAWERAKELADLYELSDED